MFRTLLASKVYVSINNENKLIYISYRYIMVTYLNMFYN